MTDSLALTKIPTQREGQKTLDDYITDVCLFRKVGDLILMAESGPTLNFKSYWLARLLLDAMADQDISTIETIVQRIDGTAPAKEDREEYANYLGSALMDVLEMPFEEVKLLRMDDPVIITMAKCVVHVSMCNPGVSAPKRRNKNLAIDMVLTRCGGRQSQPVKNLLERVYEDPDWMKGALSSGEEEAREEQD